MALVHYLLIYDHGSRMLVSQEAYADPDRAVDATTSRPRARPFGKVRGERSVGLGQCPTSRRTTPRWTPLWPSSRMPGSWGSYTQDDGRPALRPTA